MSASHLSLFNHRAGFRLAKGLQRFPVVIEALFPSDVVHGMPDVSASVIDSVSGPGEQEV